MKKFIIFIFAMLLLTSCSQSISQNVAQEKAVEFVKTKVKFYTKSNNETDIVEGPKASSIDSYKEGDFWMVIMHIKGESENGTKNNDLMVKVDGKGNVVDLKALNAKT